jgi:succinoglycan biosynthesis protein ExoA
MLNDQEIGRGSAEITGFPFVTVIVHCRNEREFIADCLETLAKNDYPKDYLEIIVVDGMSGDGTREIIQKFAQENSSVRLMDNPGKIIPKATNLAIRKARGQFIMIAGAHAYYPEDYISKCVSALQRYPVDNVGGTRLTESRTRNRLGQAIAYLLAHPLGAGSPAYHRGVSAPRLVDTVWGGCYRREVFERIGFFNENLPRGEDREFNQRLRDCGGQILLMPDIRCIYRSRSDLRDFCPWIFQAGIWPFWGSKLSKRRIFALRNFAPMLLVLIALITFATSFAFRGAIWLLAGFFLTYAVVGMISAIPLARRERDPRYLLILPWLLALTHIIYGVGGIYGILKPAPAPKPASPTRVPPR